MKKSLKIICCVLMIFMNLNFLMVSAKEDEIESSLVLETKTSGYRTVAVQIQERYFEKDYGYKGGITAFENVLQSNLPENMQYEKLKKDDDYYYIFKITFQTIDEYEKKVKSIMGEEKEVKIEYKFPNSPFSTGLSLNESFSNRDLLNWLDEKLAEKGVCDYFHSYSNIKSIRVHYNGKTYDSYSDVYVNELKENNVSKIAISTDFKDDNLNEATQKIQFKMDDKTYKGNTKEIDKYLKESVPENGAGEWSEEEDTSFWSTKNYHVFTITFDVQNLDELKTKMDKVLHNNNTKLIKEEIAGDNPLTSYYKLTETYDVSSFGNEHNIEVTQAITVTNSLKIKTFDSYHTGEQRVESQTYDATADFEYEIQQSYPIEKIITTTKVLSDEEIEKGWQFTYLKNTDKKGADLLKTYFEAMNGFHVEINEEDESVQVNVTLEGTIDEVSMALGNVFGSDNYIKMNKFDEKTTSYKTSFYEIMNYENFNTYLDYQGAYIYELIPQEKVKIDKESSMLNDFEFEDDLYKKSFNGLIEISYTGKVVLMGGVLLVTFSTLIVIVACILLYLVTKHRWLIKNDYHDVTFMEGNKLYASCVFNVVKNHLHNGILAFTNIWIPANVNRKIYLYFNGNILWLLIAACNFIYVFFTVITQSRMLDFGKLKLCLGAMCVFFIMYVISRLRQDEKTMVLIDEATKININDKMQEAMKLLGIQEEQFMLDTIMLTGPAVESAEVEKDIRMLKPYQQIISRIIDKFQYHEYLKARKGSDGKIRYNFVRYSFVFFTENQVMYYIFDQNLYTGKFVLQESNEYFYRDIIVADSGYQMKIIHDGRNTHQERISYLRIVGKSNVQKLLTINIETDELDQRFIAMKKLIKEQKQITKQEDLENE